MVVGALWGVFVFRRHVSFGRLAALAGGGALLVIIIFSVLSIEYGDVLYKRFISDSTSSDMVGASSGRLEIWANALALMSEKPLTFLTGYGWNMYWSLPTRLSPHNHYLSLWFNVGLVGLICGTLVLVLVVRQAMAALPYSPPQYRPVLISFAIGTVAISVATFFVDLIAPWLWFWAYAGLVMRIAVNLHSQIEPKRTAGPPSEREPIQRKDTFGWVGTVRNER
jgi:O-antigen ligase